MITRNALTERDQFAEHRAEDPSLDEGQNGGDGKGSDAKKLKLAYFKHFEDGYQIGDGQIHQKYVGHRHSATNCPD